MHQWVLFLSDSAHMHQWVFILTRQVNIEKWNRCLPLNTYVIVKIVLMGLNEAFVDKPILRGPSLLVNIWKTSHAYRTKFWRVFLGLPVIKTLQKVNCLSYKHGWNVTLNLGDVFFFFLNTL